MDTTTKSGKPDLVPRPETGTDRRLLWASILVLVLLIAGVAAVVVAIGDDPPATASRIHSSPVGYTVELPEAWEATRFEGHDEFRPPGMPSLAMGGDTFAIDVAPSVLFLGVPCALEEDVLTMRDGMVADGCRVTDTDGSRHAWYLVAPPTASSDVTIHLFGSTEALWNAHEELAVEILRTMGSVGEVAVEHGTLGSGIRMDRFGTAIVGFLEARILGNGADYWMGPDAESLYLDARTLYGGADGSPWLSYEVTEIRGVDANSVEFDVTLRSDTADVVETVGVGPGVNVGGVSMPAIIRFGGAS